MELELVRCTTCGSSVSMDVDLKTGICDSCGNSFIQKHAAAFALLDEFQAKQINKLRLNMDRAVRLNDLDNISFYAKEILQLLPNDYLSLYMESYCASKGSSPIGLYGFYKNLDEVVTKEQLSDVVEHIISYGELRDRKLIEQYINHYLPEYLLRYKKEYERNLKIEDHYSSIPRDVFICHRSLDENIALKVVQHLELDGNTCWISSRNLRPNDNENYWANIEEAIELSSVFIVISSADAMVSKDVQKEMKIAKGMDKPILEIKIDHSKHTTYFKHYFDGYKWINAVDSFDSSLYEITSRVFSLLHAKEKETIIKEERTNNNVNPQIVNKPKKANVEEIILYDGSFQALHTFKRKSKRGSIETVHVYYDSRVAFALSIFPIGIYGFDKIYLKDYKRALILFFTAGGFIVGWFYDSYKHLSQMLVPILKRKHNSDAESKKKAKKYALIFIAIQSTFLIIFSLFT